MKKHLYIPLDIREDVYSAVHQKWVKNLAFDIMKETPQQILAKIVLHCKQQCPGLTRLKLGELWGSPCCTTFSKMGVINGAHQYRQAKDPLRRPMQGTRHGKLA